MRPLHLLTCVTLLGIAPLCVAQPTLAQTFSLGVVGGTSGTSFSGDKPSGGSFKAGAGYLVGGHVEMTAGPNVAFVVQPVFASRSTKLEIKDNSDPTLTEVYRLQMESVSVPITVVYAFGWKTTRVFAETGMELAFLQDFRLLEDGQPDQDLQDTTESFEFSVLLGFGVKSKLKGIPWFAQLRLAAGLTNLAAGDPLGMGLDDTRWKSRSTLFVLGVTYPIFGG
jgi:hypothetical protein